MRTGLPERWYVERTPENHKVINKWLESIGKKPPSGWYNRVILSNGLSYPEGHFCGSSASSPEYGLGLYYERITYDEFTKLVLKK